MLLSMAVGAEPLYVAGIDVVTVMSEHVAGRAASLAAVGAHQFAATQSAICLRSAPSLQAVVYGVLHGGQFVKNVSTLSSEFALLCKSFPSHRTGTAN